ncbi:MAG: EAL domain-containing protein, partial [Marinobacter sp.]|nr:EAL domain-containing protein [Marinobacter sp.]
SDPFDTLKIDKSFVQDVMKEQEDASLVKAIINMAHSLGLSVIAEGVEEEAQTHFLQQQGCDYSQGYFYSRPVPHADFEKWLRTNHRVQA